MFQKIKQIIEGYFKLMFKDPKVEKIAKYRKSVCDVCPKKGHLVNISTLGINIKAVQQCKDCGCILVAKQRSSSECPMNKWKA